MSHKYSGAELWGRVFPLPEFGGNTLYIMYDLG